MKKCPFCAEEIQDEAIKCKYCKSNLAEKSYRIDDFIAAAIKYANEYCLSFVKYPKQYISLAILFIAILFPFYPNMGDWNKLDQSPNIVIYRDGKIKYFTGCIMEREWRKLVEIESFEKVTKMLIMGCLILVGLLTFKIKYINTIKKVINGMHWSIIGTFILFTIVYSMMLTEAYHHGHRFVPIYAIVVLPLFSFGLGGYMMYLSTMLYFMCPIFKKEDLK